MSKNRYEQEIEEILSKYEEEKSPSQRPPEGSSPRESRPTRPPLSPRRSLTLPRSVSDLKRMSAGQYMLAAFGVAILAIILRPLGVPPVIITMMIILSAILFLVPILLNYTRSSGGSSAFPREEKRWRGQVIDINTRRNVADDPLESIKRWLRRR
ncbi:MAG: hypothetical protein ABIO92_07835 [Chloroflexia bacterium]